MKYLYLLIIGDDAFGDETVMFLYSSIVFA